MDIDTLTSENLQNLSKDELIDWVLQLVTQVQQLKAELVALKKPPTNSRNSSQPPARDFKANRRPPKRPKKKGARAGHAKAERPLVDTPDQTIVVSVTMCDHCGADLSEVAPRRTFRRQVTEWPEIKPVVIETRQDEVVCPHCQSEQRGVLPEGLEAQRQFGPRLEALVTYLHQEQHVGFERLKTLLKDVMGITLSEGGAVAILERAGAAAQPEAEAIGERVRQSAVIQSDETSARVNGTNAWEWVFLGNNNEYHMIVPKRGYEAIAQFMGEARAEVWLSDRWKPQLKAPAELHQLCLPHLIRNLQGLIDQCPRLRWAKEMQDLLRRAIHLGHRRDELTPAGFQGQLTRLERSLGGLLARRITSQARGLQAELRLHRDHLFVFLHRSDVSSDNNACERALRPSVIHRKVMGSFRSEWGPRAYANLATVLNTAKRAGESTFQKLVHLMGTPVLHFLESSSSCSV